MESTCCERRSTAFRALLLVGPAAVLVGCSGFTSVRSAEVVPGRSIDVGMTMATPPGEDAAWFWTYDCASSCDRSIPAVDVAFTLGKAPAAGRPYEVGLGLSGFFPYAHGYVQLREGRYPFGVGGRAGVSLAGWLEAALFMRQDVPLGSNTRLLLSPGLFWHGGNSPNGANPGSFTAAAAGVGLEHSFGSVSIAPTALLVAGRVDRTSYPTSIDGPAAFAVLGLTARFGRSPGGPRGGKE